MLACLQISWRHAGSRHGGGRLRWEAGAVAEQGQATTALEGRPGDGEVGAVAAEHQHATTKDGAGTAHWGGGDGAAGR
ncbi:hypothetical protein BRADI_2g31806v3 [Brachypodium distachyon]|uniref:Uncharacterized protein n=1 Tax=Brachypodium distachyon TaxID=15368 RepID=A0A2K2DBE7_BRADI|nr:hypothetical protein BRADI_2g31806v3 [Brachypodium distachyon]